jgi:hypothetical protein
LAIDAAVSPRALGQPNLTETRDNRESCIVRRGYEFVDQVHENQVWICCGIPGKSRKRFRLIPNLGLMLRLQ